MRLDQTGKVVLVLSPQPRCLVALSLSKAFVVVLVVLVKSPDLSFERERPRVLILLSFESSGMYVPSGTRARATRLERIWISLQICNLARASRL